MPVTLQSKDTGGLIGSKGKNPTICLLQNILHNKRYTQPKREVWKKISKTFRIQK
jgi:hypothetical protein